jgi:hypothetical protein
MFVSFSPAMVRRAIPEVWTVEDLERDTDRLAAAQYEALGTAGTQRLAELLVPWAQRAMTEPD